MEVYVAGSVGPCLRPGQFLDPANRAEVRGAFAEAIASLVAGGVDLILLETFSDLEELGLALDPPPLARPPVRLVRLRRGGRDRARHPLDRVMAGLEADGARRRRRPELRLRPQHDLRTGRARP